MESDVSSQEIPQKEIIGELEYSTFRIGAFRAALELHLWEKIATGQDTASKIADHEGWDLAGSRLVLDAMCALKLLSKTGDRYALVPESAFYLVPGKTTYIGDMLLYEYRWDENGRLAETIRSGKRPLQDSATSPEMVPLWIADYSRRWAYPETYFEREKNLWQSLGIQARAGLRVLDIACGPAPRSMELARQHPGVRLTWVDWEGVLQNAVKVARNLGIGEQVTLVPGDLWSMDFGAGLFHVAYLGDVTHFFSPEENTGLFRKVYAALAPGGVIVINSVARREIEGEVWDGLWLYAATASGGLYDFGEYKALLESAGFTNVIDINNGPIRAEKI
ncbi:MAG TPA: methyltransferase domain-containing protein [Anaerolineaceae bacterium]|nr:methyltransferase domain-containing protein [Anaerolineaceae bacterium]